MTHETQTRPVILAYGPASATITRDTTLSLPEPTAPVAWRVWSRYADADGVLRDPAAIEAWLMVRGERITPHESGRLATRLDLTDDRETMGTPLYMAPEMWQRAK